jgi:hypothetical protein
MKKLSVFFILISILFFLSACDKEESTNEATQSDITGNWGVNMENYSGMSLTEKLDVYLSVSELSGALSGSGTVKYINNGSTSTTLDIQNTVSGYYQADKSPNILITVGAQTGTTPPFTFSGDWDNFGENFHGTVVINSGNQIYTLTNQSFYKRGN